MGKKNNEKGSVLILTLSLTEYARKKGVHDKFIWKRFMIVAGAHLEGIDVYHKPIQLKNNT